MDIATGPLSSLLPKLAKLLQDEYKLQKGTRKGIQFLYKELEVMHAALRKVEEVPREQLDDLQKIWSQEVRELSYDMEDIVDSFMVDVEGPDPPSKRGAKKIFNKMIRKFNKAMARREVAQEINDIEERAKEQAEQRDRLVFGFNYRYLIVIDDIWDKEPWDNVIGLSLIENNMGSRIITTSRNIDVAEHVGDCYKLQPLSDKNSETLFYGRIFGSKDKCPARFLDVSKKLLKKCGGVPLAIVTISSLLANKPGSIKVWEDVCDSIGSGLGRNNPGMDDMRKILLLSYYDLPSHLKTCLLYLSVFPEDYKISKNRLIWRWVAEGFVQQVQQATGYQISFLEIGENYFNELLNRSLIQPEDMDCMGIPKACRLHDTVLDLIITLSVEECFISTTLADGMESKVRWLSLHSSNTTWPSMKMPKLRSITIFRPDDDVAIDLTHSCHRLLRVLDLHDYRLEDLSSLRRELISPTIKPSLLPSLSCLNITVKYERSEDIQVLGMLPCLRHLKFRVLYATEQYDEAPLGRCVVRPDAFPRAVRRRGCSIVDDLGLGHFPSLRRVAALGFDIFYFDFRALTEKRQSELKAPATNLCASRPRATILLVRTGLLPKLAKLLQDEYKLQKAARKGIEFLHKELETMHAVLCKVGDVPREQLDELQRIWARDVREVSYDMEDIVDTFIVDIEGPDPPSKSSTR
ncbi:hypothetical protein HU200_060933 [Digitaria exilis]|uniref:Uncharacterized protein n=1 Tax=Digitaria exilis TaxID=1010633 RepID=A0A835A889_9POAL|nr:hypothetical protein HU200_060933 [Digitaria exilis]